MDLLSCTADVGGQREQGRRVRVRQAGNCLSV